MAKVVTREWRRAYCAKLEFAFVSAFKFWTQYPGSVVPLAMFFIICQLIVVDRDFFLELLSPPDSK